MGGPGGWLSVGSSVLVDFERVTDTGILVFKYHSIPGV